MKKFLILLALAAAAVQGIANVMPEPKQPFPAMALVTAPPSFIELGLEGDDQFEITADKWALVAVKGIEVDWCVPTEADYKKLPNLSNNIRTRSGDKRPIEEKFAKVRKRRGENLDLRVKTFDYDRFQLMDTIVNGKRGYFWGIASKNDPGIVEAQAIRVEMYLRLSEDGNWIYVMTRKFYREHAPEWCTNDLKIPSIGVCNEYTLPLPRYLFESKTTLRQICKRVVKEKGETEVIEVQGEAPLPIPMYSWNGGYHSQGSIYSEKEIASLWLNYTKRVQQHCKPNCPPPTECPPEDRPKLPPPPPPGGTGNPPNNDRDFPSQGNGSDPPLNRG